MNMIKFNEIKSEPLTEDMRELGSENNSVMKRRMRVHLCIDTEHIHTLTQ